MPRDHQHTSLHTASHDNWPGYYPERSYQLWQNLILWLRIPPITPPPCAYGKANHYCSFLCADAEPMCRPGLLNSSCIYARFDVRQLHHLRHLLIRRPVHLGQVHIDRDFISTTSATSAASVASSWLSLKSAFPIGSSSTIVANLSALHGNVPRVSPEQSSLERQTKS